VLDAGPAVRDRPDAIDTGGLSGLVEFKDVSFSYDGKRRRSKTFPLPLPGQTIALVRPDRRRQVDGHRVAASRVDPAVGLHQDRTAWMSAA